MLCKLVVADVDGTLVEKGGDIAPEVREAVAEFRAAGGLFTLATGRPVVGVGHYVRALGLDVPVIVFNGAQVYDFRAGRPLLERSLPLDVARYALEQARRYPIDPFLYAGSDIVVSAITPRVEVYMRRDRVRCVPVGDLAAFLSRTGVAPPKLLFFGDVEASLRLMADLRIRYPSLNYVQSDADFIELLPEGVSKGAALEWLASRLDVPLSAVMAIGDHHNDLDMLRRAGLGVAVANAEGPVRAEARWVTRRPCGLGVAEALRAAISGRLPLPS